MKKPEIGDVVEFANLTVGRIVEINERRVLVSLVASSLRVEANLDNFVWAAQINRWWEK